MAAMLGVTTITALTGLGLSSSSRKGAEQVFFSAYSVNVLPSVLIVAWMMPFLPEAISNCPAIDIGLGVFNLLGSAYAWHQVYSNKDEAMAGRNKLRTPPAPGSTEEALQDLAYFFPNIPGILATALVGVVQLHGGRHCMDTYSALHPEFVAATFHGILAMTLAGHCGLLGITLRDKGLISQEAEMMLAGATNIFSLAYNILLWVEYPWLVPHAMLFVV